MITTLILREENTIIEKNFQANVEYETLFLDQNSEVTDAYLNEISNKIINKKEYQNIFLPMCFGPILSDFNGLRLATHLRCTPGLNQNKNIFIFSFVEIEKLINHECFGILKTKGIKIIDYNYHSIKEHCETKQISLSLEELPFELKKIDLSIPDNYEDNHSITNEWGIYRWSESLAIKDFIIDKIITNQNQNLYFKYLKNIFPISKLIKLEAKDLKIKKVNDIKTLYIDDEASRGWSIILKKILVDINKIGLQYLDREFIGMKKSEIVKASINKIKKENFDIIILDLRLHKDDFENLPIEELTGFQILKEIKNFNKGIQVIVFSATNKIWNLQALQKTKANGFIIKESLENSIDAEFTKKSLNGLIVELENASKISFVKDVIQTCDNIIKAFPLKFSNLELISSYFDVAINLLLQSNEDKRFFNFAYLQLFQTIEIFIDSSENFLDGENAYVISGKQNVLVQKRSLDEVQWALKFNGKYIKQHETKRINPSKNLTRLDTNFKVSSLLIFKLGQENSSILNWTAIYTKRNNAVAHNTTNVEILVNDIFEILKFIEFFFDPSNIDFKNVKYGLVENTFEESIEKMKEMGTFNVINKKK